MTAFCELCGEPMPAGEEMMRYHGLTGPCPKPPLATPQPTPAPVMETTAEERKTWLDFITGDTMRISSAASFLEMVLRDFDRAHAAGLAEGRAMERGYQFIVQDVFAALEWDNGETALRVKRLISDALAARKRNDHEAKPEEATK